MSGWDNWPDDYVVEGEMEEALERHIENTDELVAQIEAHEDPIVFVDSDDNSKKYVMTDVRHDGDNIVVAIARL